MCIIRMKYYVFQIWTLSDNILSIKVCCENLHKLDCFIFAVVKFQILLPLML